MPETKKKRGRPRLADRSELVVTRTVSGKSRHFDLLQRWADEDFGGVRAQAFASLVEAEDKRRRRRAARRRQKLGASGG